VAGQPQTVYLRESGRRQPQVAQSRKLGRLFRICSDEIIFDLPEMPQRRSTRARYATATPPSTSPAAARMVAPSIAVKRSRWPIVTIPEATPSSPGVTPSSPVRCIHY
jgi:hypothetical protein